MLKANCYSSDIYCEDKKNIILMETSSPFYKLNLLFFHRPDMSGIL